MVQTGLTEVSNALGAAGLGPTGEGFLEAAGLEIVGGVIKLVGQEHHAISMRVRRQLKENPNLSGKYKYRDPRFTTRACSKDAQNGYQTWHRDLDNEVVNWLRERPTATPEQFEQYLRNRYGLPDLRNRFPGGLPPKQ